MTAASSRSVPVLTRKQNLITNRLYHHPNSMTIINTQAHPPEPLNPQDQIHTVNPVHPPQHLAAHSQPSKPKPPAHRAVKLLRKICRSRDPLNPLLDHFISPNYQSPHPSHCPPKDRLSDRSHLRACPSRNVNQPYNPVSATLSELERSNKIYSSSQVMDRSIQKLIKSTTLSHTLPQPSTSKVALDHCQPPRSRVFPPSSPALDPPFHSVEQAAQWTQIYIRFLKSSPNQEVFARRIKELIHKRLPKRLTEPIIRFHSLVEELVSVDSYNHLIAYYYQAEKYHHARRLMNEMEERGILKNQETQELIACSYQALNKFKGVQLTLDSIKADGHQVSSQCLTKLFSIRPRRPSKLEHLDSMDDPLPCAGADNPQVNPSTERVPSIRTEDQRWMPIKDFLKHHCWNSENFRKDGRALVTLAKRLMELGRWKDAKEFVEMILTLDVNRSTMENTRLAISPYWATSLLEALVFGLYNLKRQQSAQDPKLSSHCSQAGPDKTDTCTADHNWLPVDCVFQFVEQFIDQHPGHRIKANTRILLNCLRIQTFLPPSEIHRILNVWTSQYGLEQDQMGSRSGIRFMHVISAWFLQRLRTTQSQISSLSWPNPPSSFAEEIRSNLNKLVMEYMVIDEHLIGCLSCTRPRAASSTVPGTASTQREETLLIEQLILNGPVDGKLVQSNYRFLGLQDIHSVKTSLKKIFKIRTKIVRLMVLNLRVSTAPPLAHLMQTAGQEDAEEEVAGLDGSSSADLLAFYHHDFGGDGCLLRFLGDGEKEEERSPFQQKFHVLLNQFKTLPPDPSLPHEDRPLTLELVNKLPTPTRPRTPGHRLPAAYHALLCWRSEDRHSKPIYFKSSSAF